MAHTKACRLFAPRSRTQSRFRCSGPPRQTRPAFQGAPGYRNTFPAPWRPPASTWPL